MKYFVVDAFAEKVFGGNPAGVCVMKEWLPTETMQAIAFENNLSETAFAVKEPEGYRLRWFTPTHEVSLCGHATLGAAFVVLNFYEKNLGAVTFNTITGPLSVAKKDNFYELDFPAYDLEELEVTKAMEEAVGMPVLEARYGRDMLCVVENEDLVVNARPNLEKIAAMSQFHGCIITARGTKYDCVSRCFYPRLAVNEDPVTGSAHCHILPFWAGKLGKTELLCRQASARGGTLVCRLENGRANMAGPAALYLEGEINF